MACTDAHNGFPTGDGVVSKLRICVLHSSYDGSEAAMAGLDPYSVPEIHDKAGKYEWHHAYIKKATSMQQVRDLARSKKYDVFLNLCDGAADEDRAGMDVVTALDRYRCAYTGANAVFYEPSKELMKKMAYYYDINTAPWAFVYDVDMQNDAVAEAEVQRAVHGLRYPLIVKHFNGYSSVGMGRDCKVQDSMQLMQQVRKFVGTYGGALVEEFIPGREFTVLVVENARDPDAPLTLLPVECTFGPGEEFKHFDLKWREYESMGWRPLNASLEPGLDQELRRMAALAFVALKGCSYGRCDFRVDEQGRVFFLEINPNCGLFYPEDQYGSADIILSLDPKMDHAQFTDHIVSCALARHRLHCTSRATEVRYKHGSGYGLYATRDLPPGAVVVKYEERQHVIATCRHVARTFGPDCVPGPSPVDQPTTLSLQAGVTPSNHKLTQENGIKADALAGLNVGNDTKGTPGVENGSSNGGLQGLGQQCEGQALNGVGQGSGGASSGTATHLTRLRGQWFKAYAYPITDEIWVTWSEDPDDWLPLNHSCDPNTWLDGLNLVACRSISKGEQVSADYATYSVHNMHEFQCHCGAARCRGLVRGSDYLEDWVEQQYGDHVSGYVASKRAQLKEQRQQQLGLQQQEEE